MTDTTTVAIAGGGPAGIVLGLLLARAGVEVTVLEKHEDFLRDFRGDTVHPTTQVVLDELGLTDRFQRIVLGRMRELRLGTPAGPLLEVDLERTHRRHPFHEVAMAPQSDLLDLLADEAGRYPRFTLKRSAEVLGPVRRNGHVAGVRYRDARGEHELRSVLTVAADGRHSVLRAAIGGRLRDLDAPLDVLWFRLARHPGDPEALTASAGDRSFVVAINRQDYWQVAYPQPAGRDAEIRAAGLPAFRRSIAAVLPWAGDRVGELRDWDEVKTLRVTVTRLERWAAPGILAIGDAAHAMSPVGGVGINLAVQDAVAAANLLAEPLRRAQADPRRFERTLDPALLRRVQRRREPPTAITQLLQVAIQRGPMRVALERGLPSVRIPPVLRWALRNGPLARLVPRVFVYGLRPEHVRVPEYVGPSGASGEEAA